MLGTAISIPVAAYEELNLYIELKHRRQIDKKLEFLNVP